MEDKRLKYLLNRHKQGHLSAEEFAELNEWYAQIDFKDGDADLSEIDTDQFYREFRQRVGRRQKIRPLFGIYTAAAIVVSVLAIGIWLSLPTQPKTQSAGSYATQPIKPGGNKAYLTLQDGSRIALDDIPSGEIARLEGIYIAKGKGGQLIYKSDSEADAIGEAGYNLIETPRGGQYQIILPDGSHVWLNAASSLRYPARFNGSERRVELKGEAYFEVAPNPRQPFLVTSEDQSVEVLGTHFNVKAYSEERSTLTTLLEGSVKVVNRNGHSETMRPGQQSRVNRSELQVSEVNTEPAVAWKEGKFMFGNDNLEGVMQQIARWYDVEIEYKNGIPQKRVWGTVSRFDNVEDVLKLLEMSKLAQFEIKGRRIIVMK